MVHSLEDAIHIFILYIWLILPLKQVIVFFNRSALDIVVFALGPGKKVMHNQVLKNLIVGITLPEFEPVVTLSCYWTNVC